MSGQTPLPNDPEVKVGKLDNGMTYYIRHNAQPAQRAEFYLATNVGAFQESDDQDGLAHFLEHMCFNGTKNFPGKALLDWLQSKRPAVLQAIPDRKRRFAFHHRLTETCFALDRPLTEEEFRHLLADAGEL